MTARTWLAAAIVGTLLCAVSAHADPILVFGNLYQDPEAQQSNLTNNFDTAGPTAAAKLIAQGFVSGTGLLQVTSVQLNIESLSGSQSGTVAFYASTGTDQSDEPTGSPIHTSSAVAVSGRSTYTFTFANALLSPSTGYWLVPQFAADFKWFESNGLFSPIPLDYTGDTYFWLRTKKSGGSISDPWSFGDPRDSFAIFATAAPVPEIDPAGLGSVMGLVCGGLGLVERRRRMATVDI